MNTGSARILTAVREQRPLVHCLTNAVTMGRVADALAALGALPVMASAPDEAADMVAHAQVLLLNLGTPTTERFASARSVADRARTLRIPVVLDPVGCGATAWRTREIVNLTRDAHPTVVRGNAPEVAALIQVPTPIALRGITADRQNSDTACLARMAGIALECVVAVTGKQDAVSDGQRSFTREPESAILDRVVGAGDVLTALIAACHAVEHDAYAATCAGLDVFHLAVRKASDHAMGPGTFWPGFLDVLAALSADTATPVPAASC